MAKFILILKGSLDIVNFDNYFLIRNKKNKKEVEYAWGGKVPNEGKMTFITFSKNIGKCKLNLFPKYIQKIILKIQLFIIQLYI